MADQRVVGAPEDLAHAAGVQELDHLRVPVLRGVPADRDVDVGVLPGHRDHLLDPRPAVVGADQVELGEVDRDAVDQDRTAAVRGHELR